MADDYDDMAKITAAYFLVLKERDTWRLRALRAEADLAEFPSNA